LKERSIDEIGEKETVGTMSPFPSLLRWRNSADGRQEEQGGDGGKVQGDAEGGGVGKERSSENEYRVTKNLHHIYMIVSPHYGF